MNCISCPHYHIGHYEDDYCDYCDFDKSRCPYKEKELTPEVEEPKKKDSGTKKSWKYGY